MTQRIVDILEIIQIEKQQRQFLARLSDLDHFLMEPVQQHPAIGQTGQKIEIGLAPDHIFRFFLFGEILGKHDIIANGTILVINDIDRQPCRIQFTVLFPVPQLATPDPLFTKLAPHRLVKRPVLTP